MVPYLPNIEFLLNRIQNSLDGGDFHEVWRGEVHAGLEDGHLEGEPVEELVRGSVVFHAVDVAHAHVDDVPLAAAELADHDARRAVALGVDAHEGEDDGVLEGEVGELRGEFEARGLFKVEGDDRGHGDGACHWGVEDGVAEEDDFGGLAHVRVEGDLEPGVCASEEDAHLAPKGLLLSA